MFKNRYLVIAAALIALASFLILGFKTNKTTQVLHAKTGDVLEAIYGLGKVKSDENYEVKIGIIATVKKLYVKEGDRVAKGQKLIAFEETGLFRAPFNGTVTSTVFKEAEIVTPQAPILRLQNLDKKYIEVSLEQEAALKVRPNQTAKLIFESVLGKNILGTVQSIYPKNGEFIAHIEAEKLDSNILPGMTADVVIEVGSKKDATLIPVKAISGGQVVRRRNGEKLKVPVSVGYTDGLWAELTEGDIKVTDELVVKGK